MTINDIRKRIAKYITRGEDAQTPQVDETNTPSDTLSEKE